VDQYFKIALITLVYWFLVLFFTWANSLLEYVSIVHGPLELLFHAKG
jgi:hypothetical protein